MIFSSFIILQKGKENVYSLVIRRLEVRCKRDFTGHNFASRIKTFLIIFFSYTIYLNEIMKWYCLTLWYTYLEFSFSEYLRDCVNRSSRVSERADVVTVAASPPYNRAVRSLSCTFVYLSGHSRYGYYKRRRSLTSHSLARWAHCLDSTIRSARAVCDVFTLLRDYKSEGAVPRGEAFSSLPFVRICLWIPKKSCHILSS